MQVHVEPGLAQIQIDNARVHIESEDLLAEEKLVFEVGVGRRVSFALCFDVRLGALQVEAFYFVFELGILVLIVVHTLELVDLHETTRLGVVRHKWWIQAGDAQTFQVDQDRVDVQRLVEGRELVQVGRLAETSRL